MKAGYRARTLLSGLVVCAVTAIAIGTVGFTPTASAQPPESAGPLGAGGRAETGSSEASRGASDPDKAQPHKASRSTSVLPFTTVDLWSLAVAGLLLTLMAVAGLALTRPPDAEADASRPPALARF